MQYEERIKTLFESAYLLTGLTRIELGEVAYNKPEKIMVRKVISNILFKDVSAGVIAPLFKIHPNAVSAYDPENLGVTELKMKKEMMVIYCKLMESSTTVVTYEKNQRLPDSIVWNDEQWQIVPTVAMHQEKLDRKKVGMGYKKHLAL